MQPLRSSLLCMCLVMVLWVGGAYSIGQETLPFRPELLIYREGAARVVLLRSLPSTLVCHIDRDAQGGQGRDQTSLPSVHMPPSREVAIGRDRAFFMRSDFTAFSM